MIKHFSFLLAVSLMLLSCGSKKTVYTVETLLPVVEEQLEKEIIIKGEVTHVCNETGKKCFIKAENSDESIRVTVPSSMDVFSQDLVGKTIEVKGIVREQKRVEEAEIAEQEAKLEEAKAALEEMATDTTAVAAEVKQHCDTEQNSIDKMREWMKKNGKNYYAIYYIEGTELLKTK